MKLSEIERLLKQPEGQFLERKSCYEYKKGNWKIRKAKDVAKDIAETLCAFANSDGGTLLLGVDDYGHVSGVDFPDDKLKVIRNAPKRLIKPALPAQVKEHHLRNKKIFLFTVSWKPEVYQLTDGRYLLRIGGSNMPFPADQIELLKSGKRKAAFDSRIEPTATWNDISPDLIRSFGERIKTEKSEEEILSEYRLIEYDNGNPRFKLAALLLFGKDPLRWHPRCGIDFVKYEGTERKVGRELNIIKRVRIDSPLFKLIDDAYTTISSHIKERQFLHDLFFVENLEYPTFAWQEAIVNAVAHRDYSIAGLSTEIWMFDDRIEIRSPGLPPEPVSLEKILRRERIHASRNPLIVRVLTDLGYMRETGEGIPRMFAEMERNALFPPEIAIVADSLFSVTLKNQPMYSYEDMKWLEKFENMNLNPDQKRMLLFARAHGGSFTSRDWQKVCGVDIYSASRDIKDMIRKGCLVHPQKGGRVYNIIYPERRKKIEFPKKYRLIKKILDEKGFITNKDIQSTIKVPRFKAVRIASELVDLGLLEPTGKGRGAKYIRSRGQREGNEAP
ncbi:MAG: putative DNA binding domain-containing protein [Deltaproteobacteria bacterium]|nr:putative DNA binding domain-containing protein [Deltaproteobacteria bacterium]